MVNLVQLGIILICIGFLLLFLSAFLTNKSTVRGGFVGFIGPFPFGFASDKKILYILFAIGIIIFILSILLRKFL